MRAGVEYREWSNVGAFADLGIATHRLFDPSAGPHRTIREPRVRADLGPRTNDGRALQHRPGKQRDVGASRTVAST